MSKFHINKHGVPAPCRATKGNCPLGGDSGNENHYNTQEEAQAAADKMNESQHGIISGIEDVEQREQAVDVTVSDETFNYVFAEASDNHGYMETGVHKVHLTEHAEMEDDEHLKELRDSLPDEVLNDEENYTIVPDYNTEKFFRYHVISSNKMEDDSGGYDKMIATVKEHNPEMIGKGFRGEVIKEEMREELVSYASQKALDESNLTINGNKMIKGRYNGRNWAKEYYTSQDKEQIVEIDDQAYNGAFPPTYDNNGYTMTGVQKSQLDEAEGEGNEALIELKKQLPQEIVNDKEDFTLVPKHNAQDYYATQVVSADTQDGSIDNYRAMTDSVKEYDPELIREHMSEDAIDREFEGEIAKFAANKMLNESKLTINGQKTIVAKNDDRNWAKEYIESMRNK